MGWLKNFLDGGASEAQKKNEAVAAGLSKMLEEQYGFGIAKLLEGLSGIDAGFDAAQAELASAGGTATKQIMDLHQQALAEGKQSLIDMGMSGTTLEGNLATQVAQGTSFSLGALAEKLAGLKAGLHTEEAGAKFGALSNIADFAMNKVNVKQGISPHYQAAGGGFLGGLSEGLGSWVGGGGLGNLFPGGGGGSAAPGSTLDIGGKKKGS